MDTMVCIKDIRRTFGVLVVKVGEIIVRNMIHGKTDEITKVFLNLICHLELKCEVSFCFDI